MDNKINSKSLMISHPNHRPIIIIPKNETTLSIKKKRFLVPMDDTIGLFQIKFRKLMKKLNENEALFIFTENNTLLSSGELISTVYEKNKNKDGMLYLYISLENTFGSNSYES